MQEDVPLHMKRTLRISNIPIHLLNIVPLAAHFGRFGIVSNILVRPPVRGASHSEAYVQFSAHAPAARAKGAPDPVCGEPAIAVSWARHDPSAPEGMPPESSAPEAPAGSGSVRDKQQWAGNPGSQLQSSTLHVHSGGSAAPAPPASSPMSAAQALLDKQRDQAAVVDSAIARYKAMLSELQAGRAGMDKAALASAMAAVKSQAEAIKSAQAKLAAAVATAQRAALSAQEAEEKKAQAALSRFGNNTLVAAASQSDPVPATGRVSSVPGSVSAQDFGVAGSSESLVTGEDELTASEVDSAAAMAAAEVKSATRGEEMYRGGGIEERDSF